MSDHVTHSTHKNHIIHHSTLVINTDQVQILIVSYDNREIYYTIKFSKRFEITILYSDWYIQSMEADTYHIGNYCIDYNRCIGTGAYSHVYIGTTDKQTITENNEGIVAIKVVHKNLISKKVLIRLEKEIQIMKILQTTEHPNVVRCYDVIETSDTVYFVLEFCDSGDLGRLIKRPMKEKYVQFYICQMISGMKFLVDNGIIHHDIKPRNILLTMNKKIIKIADFGFSTLANDTAKYLSLCGSPLYMAPEIMNIFSNNSRQLLETDNNKTDIWSIGMLMYEMLFNVHPFKRSETISDLIDMMNTQNIDIPPKGTNNSLISDDCMSILHQLLQKDYRYRINWDSLCCHPWTNKYWISQEGEYKVNYIKETNDIALSFQSLQTEMSTKESLAITGDETDDWFNGSVLNHDDDYVSYQSTSKPIPIPLHKS